MGEYNNRRGRSIFRRLIVSFLLVMIPIYTLGIYIYNWGLKTVKNEISQSTQAQVNFYLDRLEEEIERIKILQYDCLNDSSLQKLAIRHTVMDEYDNVSSILQLHQRLVTIKNSSSYIDNVSAHIPPIDKTISANTAINNVNLENFEQIRVPPNVTGAQIIFYSEGLYLTTLQQDRFTGRNPLYSLEVDLNETAFEEALEQFNTYPGSGSFLIFPANEIVLTNQTENKNFTPQMLLPTYAEVEDSGSGYSTIDNQKYYYVYGRSQYLNMILLRYMPQKLILTPLKSFYVWVWIFSLSALVIIVAYSIYTHRLIHIPLIELVKSFQKVEKGDMDVRIECDSNNESNNEFGYLYRRFNDMVRNLSMLIDQVYKQRILMQRAELKQLQSQINPHFLYNSFFMINTMARIGDENLIPFTRHLGEYFRFITRNSSDYIPLSEEVGHARTYTEIQLMRFSKRVELQFADCPPEYSDLKVPRLILQPVVENAFEHAVEKKKCNGFIRISFSESGDNLNISVEDNGSDFSDEQLQKLQKRLLSANSDVETTGLLNIHRRIRLIFGANCGLQVNRSQLGGLQAIIVLSKRGD
jgi:two-component system sensor histidine kinase YesM